eukprot:gb/GEZJ01006310.1/.p1 GENE.gb/GEZJ01006310.1/~~gb/GEZJ01006310.1/.p1  ORF type:complete len:365 (-),score=34.51 gb/GEZJ01006310.1/:600-1580(-)
MPSLGESSSSSATLPKTDSETLIPSPFNIHPPSVSGDVSQWVTAPTLTAPTTSSKNSHKHSSSVGPLAPNDESPSLTSSSPLTELFPPNFAPSAAAQQSRTASLSQSASDGHPVAENLPYKEPLEYSASLIPAPPLLDEASPSPELVTIPEPSYIFIMSSPAPSLLNEGTYPGNFDITVPIGISTRSSPNIQQESFQYYPSFTLGYMETAPAIEEIPTFEAPSMSLEFNAENGGLVPSQWSYAGISTSPETANASLEPWIVPSVANERSLFPTAESSELPLLSIPSELIGLFDSLYSVFEIPTAHLKGSFSSSPEASPLPSIYEVM